MPPTGKDKELKLPAVYVTNRAQPCSGCKNQIPQSSLIHISSDDPVCTLCAESDKLVVLRSGLGELTKLAAQYSSKKYVIQEWSHTYQKWQRIGLLAEHEAIVKAAVQLQDKVQTLVESPLSAKDARFEVPQP